MAYRLVVPVATAAPPRFPVVGLGRRFFWLSWRHVVKVTKYLTDMRDFDGLHRVMNGYMGDWRPASTTICVNSLSSPGARIEIDMIAVASPAP